MNPSGDRPPLVHPAEPCWPGLRIKWRPSDRPCRGGKSGSLSVNGKPLRLTLRNCTTPFEVSSYDRVSDRKSLDLRANDEVAAFLTRLDTELKKYAGKVGCAESGYTSLLKQQKEGFAALYRNKITITPAGKSA